MVRYGTESSFSHTAPRLSQAGPCEVVNQDSVSPSFDLAPLRCWPRDSHIMLHAGASRRLLSSLPLWYTDMGC